MKPKTAVTLLFWVVVIAVAWAAVRRSGLDRAFGDLLSPAPRGGDIGARSSPSSLLADLIAGPATGSGPGGGPGSFGAASSPVANSVGVAAAAVPVASPGAPASGAVSKAVAAGTIGPAIVDTLKGALTTQQQSITKMVEGPLIREQLAYVNADTPARQEEAQRLASTYGQAVIRFDQPSVHGFEVDVATYPFTSARMATGQVVTYETDELASLLAKFTPQQLGFDPTSLPAYLRR